MKLAERIALNTFLSEYPRDKTYDEVILMLEEQDPKILIWNPFEFKEIDDIIEWIENLKIDIEVAIKQGEKGEEE